MSVLLNSNKGGCTSCRLLHDVEHLVEQVFVFDFDFRVAGECLVFFFRVSGRGGLGCESLYLSFYVEQPFYVVLLVLVLFLLKT